MSFWLWVLALMALSGASGFFYGTIVGSDMMLRLCRQRYIGIPPEE